MTKIDHLFVSTDWLEILPRAHLQALASLGSDHCSVFLQGDVELDFYRGFKFEAHWAKMPGFTETVQEAWNSVVNTQDDILRIHVKLLCTAKALKNWRPKSLAGYKFTWAILNITLTNLEKGSRVEELNARGDRFQEISQDKGARDSSDAKSASSSALVVNLDS